MRTGFFGVAAGLAAFLNLASGALARPLTPAENRYAGWQAKLPPCAYDGVVSTVQSRFDQRESYYWKSGLEITRLDAIRETGFRTTGLDYIPRRYCEAKAVMNDGRVRAVYYSVAEDLNMTGGDLDRGLTQTLTFGLFPDLNLSWQHKWGVDWCVVGLDRNYAYGQACKAARP